MIPSWFLIALIALNAGGAIAFAFAKNWPLVAIMAAGVLANVGALGMARGA